MKEDSNNKKLKGLLKSTKYGAWDFQTYNKMPALEDPKAEKNLNNTGTRNPTKKYAAKRCTRLSNITTHVLYSIVQYRNPRIQVVVRDCVAQQPAYTTKKIQKKKK